MKKLWHNRVLVVGTTADYIDWIRRSAPERALFITDPIVRGAAIEDQPAPHEELLVPLEYPQAVLVALNLHLANYDIKLSGITCFDCEHMGLTADLADSLGLVYQDRKAVEGARDKYLSKQIWQAAGVDCPAAALVNTAGDARAFLARVASGIVLKPVAGSGSELVFRCHDPREVDTAFDLVRDELKTRAANPLFKSGRSDLMLAEEMIPGPEYSCDFIMGKTTADVIRVTRKIKHRHLPFGTIAGYALVTDPGTHMDMNRLGEALYRAASALGIQNGICMVDFILARDRRPVLIEMTPRPGGDCLPQLLRRAGGIDIISLALDVAEAAQAGRTPALNGNLNFRPMIALKILAKQSGVLKKIDVSELTSDLRIREIQLTRQPGHEVVLPPQDYDKWNLGHITFLPDSPNYPDTQSVLISQKVKVEMQQ